MSRRSAETAGAVVLALGAVVLWALTRTYPNYDSYYHLVWGRELLSGAAPTFEAYAAPTQHPLYVALGALLSMLGEDADRALVLVCLVSHAALVLGAYRLGRAVFGPWPGVLAALFVAASASFLLYAARAYVDAPFLALVVWAAVLAAEGRSATGAMALLVLAGLLRPEAWVLGVLYWLWLGPRRAAPAAAALAAPLVWALLDLVATGDPLHSFNATTELADDLGREQGLRAVPGSFVSFVSATVRPPVALLALAGLALAVWRLGWARSRVPLALVGAGVATFLGTGVLGLSILPRYLTVPAVAMCVFAGYALAGFTTLPPGDPLRRRWHRASAAAAVAGAATVVVLAPSLARVSAELRFIRVSHHGLVALLDDPRVRSGLRCGPLTFPNYRLVPDARWHLDLPRGRVTARSARRRPYGVAIFALTPKGLRRFGFADGASSATNIPDPGFVPLARNDRFSAYARCPGGRSLSRVSPSAPTAAGSAPGRSD
ncbi:MAG TPA: glycosyltransferase family 39 protein [Solirubrobacteraceae bacterium]|nr:glycosyltransferase family 39 protein [Solirubrobacteraceae bacterium]